MQVQAQDLAHYKRIVKELSSSKYQGRGYARSVNSSYTRRYSSDGFLFVGAPKGALQWTFGSILAPFCA